MSRHDVPFEQPPAGLGIPNPKRGKLFKPFAALKGYYELVHEMERVTCPQASLTEEDALRLSQLLCRVSKGDMVRVTYYSDGQYLCRTACVRQVDQAFRRLVLVSGCVAFDQISDLEVLASPESF